MRIANYNINKNIKWKKTILKSVKTNSSTESAQKAQTAKFAILQTKKKKFKELKNTFQRKKQSNKFLKN